MGQTISRMSYGLACRQEEQCWLRCRHTSGTRAWACLATTKQDLWIESWWVGWTAHTWEEGVPRTKALCCCCQHCRHSVLPSHMQPVYCYVLWISSDSLFSWGCIKLTDTHCRHPFGVWVYAIKWHTKTSFPFSANCLLLLEGFIYTRLFCPMPVSLTTE